MAEVTYKLWIYVEAQILDGDYEDHEDVGEPCSIGHSFGWDQLKARLEHLLASNGEYKQADEVKGWADPETYLSMSDEHHES